MKTKRTLIGIVFATLAAMFAVVMYFTQSPSEPQPPEVPSLYPQVVEEDISETPSEHALLTENASVPPSPESTSPAKTQDDNKVFAISTQDSSGSPTTDENWTRISDYLTQNTKVPLLPTALNPYQKPGLGDAVVSVTEDHYAVSINCNPNAQQPDAELGCPPVTFKAIRTDAALTNELESKVTLLRSKGGNQTDEAGCKEALLETQEGFPVVRRTCCGPKACQATDTFAVDGFRYEGSGGKGVESWGFHVKGSG